MTDDTVTTGLYPTRMADNDAASVAAMTKSWGWLFALGALLIVGGVAALLMPVIASIAVTTIVAIVLLLGGAVQGAHVLTCDGWRARLFHFASAVVYLVGGLLIMLNPLAGLITINLTVLTVFFIDGIARVSVGVAMRPQKGWGWVAGGGVVSILFAGVLLMMFPDASLFLLGILAGVAFISEGAAFLMVALAARKVGTMGREFAEDL